MPRVPWLTSNQLIEDVKRKISFPISQATFTEEDVLSFANDEMMISQVPSVLQFHEEYFTTVKQVNIQSGISRYSIPDRAIGMKLRDLFYVDSNGNMFEMTKIEEEHKASFQFTSGGGSATNYTFFLEGNDIVLQPSVTSGGESGSLLFVFYLRPNQLVKDEKAAIIEAFNQTITVNNSFVVELDTVSIDDIIFTAVANNSSTITSITTGTSPVITTSAPHKLSSGQKVTINSSDCVPSIDGTRVVTVLSSTTFSVDIEVGTAGSSGSITSPNHFVIGASSALTASNLASAINSVGDGLSSTVNSNIVILAYEDINSEIEASRTVAFVIPEDTIGIEFTDLPSTYTDQETNEVSDLFINGSIIDILQTKPGHKTYIYDLEIPASGISGDTIFFNKDDLKIPPSSTVISGIENVYANIIPGDYICLANECIIPQIPPDLHNGLAERTAARILASLGDTQGLQNSMQKIQEIESRQGTLLDNRVEGSPAKINNRHSLLRYGRRRI